MDADHSIELGPTAPALELPWRDPEGRVHYFDLRANPSSIDRIPEALQFPALRDFLLTLNSAQSCWQTAKCDVWLDEAEPTENLYNASFTQSCYVDLVLAPPNAPHLGNFATHRRIAQDLAHLLDVDDALEASAEIVVRRCYFHSVPNLEDSDAGYCLTLFLTGYGASVNEANQSWQCAMECAAQALCKLPPPAGQAKPREVR